MLFSVWLSLHSSNFNFSSASHSEYWLSGSFLLRDEVVLNRNEIFYDFYFIVCWDSFPFQYNSHISQQIFFNSVNWSIIIRKSNSIERNNKLYILRSINRLFQKYEAITQCYFCTRAWHSEKRIKTCIFFLEACFDHSLRLIWHLLLDYYLPG